jgi:hypothetical protein
MRYCFHLNGTMRTTGLWLVALAFAMKLLVAPGMMPVVEAGAVHITICTGSGSVATTLGLAGHKGSQGQTAQEACPFAALAWSALSTVAQPLAVPPLVHFGARLVLLPLRARAPPVALPPPATGPPSFV